MNKDGSSPLHLIREKEIEISARILTAKRAADSVVSDARKRATEVVVEAQGDAARLAEDQDRKISEVTNREVADVGASAAAEMAELEQALAGRREAAVAFILESVLKV